MAERIISIDITHLVRAALDRTEVQAGGDTAVEDDRDE